MNFLKLATVVVFFTCMITTVKGMENNPGLDEPTLVFETENDASSLVIELNLPSKESNIKMADINGNVLFAEEMSQKRTYKKRFNLENLRRGEYRLTTENSIRSIVYTIKVEKGNARLVNKKIVHKPFFRVMEDKVYVHFIKPDNKRVTINIYNSNGDIVNTESFINRSGALRSFNFSDAQKDTYKVGVLANEISYYESIEIK